MLIMTQKGLNGVLRDNFKIGAQAGISVVTLGSGVEGAIGGASPPDIVVWSSSTGLYGGLTVDGSVIRAEPNQDSAFYGRTGDVARSAVWIGRQPSGGAPCGGKWMPWDKTLRGAWRACYCARPSFLGDSLAVKLPALTRASLVRIQVPQPSARIGQ